MQSSTDTAPAWDLIPTVQRKDALENIRHTANTDYGRLLYSSKVNHLWHLTSVYILTTKVVPVEEHELDPVALVQCHQTNQQHQDGSQTSGQLHCVHQLC